MKMTLFLNCALILSVFSAGAYADSGNFTVSGMHCGGCAKSIAAKVCKMDGVDKCDVKVGSITMTTKEGFALDTKKVEELVTQAGDEYKVTKSEITKSEVTKSESNPAKK